MNRKKIISEDFEAENQKNVSKVNENEKTKKKSNAQKAMPWMIVAIVSLLIILTCVLIAYYQVYKSSKQNANILEGVYASSYYSMVDNVNNLAVDLSKYSTLSTEKSKLETMQDMMVDCNFILAGLSVFLFFGCKAATKGIVLLTKAIALGIKKSFVGKESL